MTGVPVVPLRLYRDNSAFATEVDKAFKRMLDPKFAPSVAFLEATRTAPEPRDASRARPAHLSELVHLSPWSVWIYEWSNGATLPAALTESAALFTAQTRLAFLKVPDGTPFEQIPKPADGIITFVFREHAGDLRRTVAQLAEGCASYVFAAWRRYCEANNGNWRDALTLPEGDGVYTLGVGSAGPDMEYHGTRWSHLLAERCRAEWMKKPEHLPTLDFPSAKTLVELHLPQPEFLAIEGATEPRGNEVIVSYEVVRVTFFRELPRLPRRPFVGARDALASALGGLSRQEAVFRLSALPQAKRLVTMASEKVQTFVREQLSRHSTVPSTPRGCMLRMRQATSECEGWLNGLAEATAHSPAHARPQELFARARHWIEHFPNLGGALLRLCMVLVTMLWLALGSQAAAFAEALQHEGWSGAWFAARSMAPAHRYLAGRMDVAFFILALLIVGWWFLRGAWVDRLLEIARQSAVIRLLLRVCEGIAESLRAAGKQIGDEYRVRLRALDCLLIELAAPMSEPGISSTNRDPRFPDTALDPLLNANIDGLVATVHERVMADDIQNSGAVQLDPEKWKCTLINASAGVAHEAVRTLSFEAVAERLNFTRPQKERLFEDAVRDSRQPAFPTASIAPARGLTLLSHRWKDFAGRYDQIVFCDQPASRLVVVTAIPVTPQVPI